MKCRLCFVTQGPQTSLAKRDRSRDSTGAFLSAFIHKFSTVAQGQSQCRDTLSASDPVHSHATPTTCRALSREGPDGSTTLTCEAFQLSLLSEQTVATRTQSSELADDRGITARSEVEARYESHVSTFSFVYTVIQDPSFSKAWCLFGHSAA